MWSTLLEIADETCAEEERELAHAVVHLGMTHVQVRDYTLAQIASYTESAEPLLLAMSSCTGSAPKHLQPCIAAITATARAPCAIATRIRGRIPQPYSAAEEAALTHL